MSEPARAPSPAEPDENGYVHLRLPGVETETFFVDGPDERGQFHLVPVEPTESIPEDIRRILEEGRAHPERWVRNRPRAR